MRKIVLLLLAIATLFMLSGCSSHNITIAPQQPKKYEVLGKAEGSASGSLGIIGTAYYFIPMGLNSRSERAYKNAIDSVPGATGLINVTYQEDWLWWLIGTSKDVTIKGDAIREIKE